MYASNLGGSHVQKGGEEILHGDKLSYPGSPVLPLNLTMYVLLIRITIIIPYIIIWMNLVRQVERWRVLQVPGFLGKTGFNTVRFM